MDAVLKLLQDCPHFDYKGILEVSEMMQRPG